MARALLGVGIALAAVGAGEARAGAWVAPEDGQRIWTAVAGERDGLTFVEGSAYLEGPLTADISIVGSSWAEYSYTLEEGYRGEVTVGVKYAVFRDDHGVMALQGGALWRSDPPQGCGEGGVELRWLGGRNVGGRGFVNLEVAGRLLEGGCGGERVELTAGFRPAEQWLALGQVFLDSPREGDESLQLQVSVVRFTSTGRGIQLGVRARLDGEDAAPALVLGLWGRNGD